jgi:hypothetical protein
MNAAEYAKDAEDPRKTRRRNLLCVLTVLCVEGFVIGASC